MEKLITDVISVCLNFALDLRDTVTHRTQATAYYKVENSITLTEVRPLLHPHVQSVDKAHLARKRVPHGFLWQLRVDGHRSLLDRRLELTSLPCVITVRLRFWFQFNSIPKGRAVA